MVAEYNPQQWGMGGPTLTTGGAYRPHTQHATVQLTADLTTDPLPSPPPPYTPNPNQSSPVSALRSSHGSPSYSLGSVLSSANHSDQYGMNNGMGHPSAFAQNQPNYGQPRQSMGSSPTQHPGMAVPQMSFPPPPGGVRERSNSRPREALGSLFNLSALRNRSTDRLGNSHAQESNRMPGPEAHARNQTLLDPSQNLAQRRQMGPSSNRVSMYIAPTEPVPLPPSARRSASAGAMVNFQPQVPSNDQGMALPPPPPGPPPNASRSMSIDRAPNPVPILSMPTRRPPHRGTALGPVPPTPAGWTDQPLNSAALVAPAEYRASPVQENDTSTDGSRSNFNSDVTDASSGASHATHSSSIRPSGSGLRREGSIRERRSESRAARDLAGSSREGELFSPMSRVGTGRPADLNLSGSTNNSPITRHGAVKKPRSAAASPLDSRFADSRKTPLTAATAATASPAFSPALDSARSGVRVSSSQLNPLSNGKFPGTSMGAFSGSKSQFQSIQTAGQPSSPYTPNQLTGKSTHGKSFADSDRDAFASACLERFQGFLDREKHAVTDRERLELFAEFFVAESRLRRDRYASAFSGMASEMFDLTRDLWKSNIAATPMVESAMSNGTSGPTPPPVSRTDSIESYPSASSPVSSRANFTPQTEVESPAYSTSSGGPRENTGWATNYHPVLSPIPSMAMSAVNEDEENSRGRPASRWWESSQGSVGNGQRLERTKRESKYMGLHKEARMNLQWEAQDSPSGFSTATPRGIDANLRDNLYNSNEKGGWAAEGSSASLNVSKSQSGWYPSAPNTPDPHKLDVSHLVTLPPPFPRHYPAMNNNHPDLESLRVTLRSLTELDEIRDVRQSFMARWEQQQKRFEEESAMRETEMRHNIQEQIQTGQMSYSSAAAAENEFHSNEARLKQKNVKDEFDEFQPQVMSPSHAFLSERITKANACVSQLKAGLSDSAQDPSRNQPQEEGDEMPELLEKLNLLKWLFEAREALHRELYDLEGERNEHYRKVVTTPMRLAGEQDQLNNAEQFFHSDRQERKLKYENSKRKRAEDFALVIEQNVTRGAEDQLNAFWDIAPGLLAVVQKVPREDDLSNFEIRIPPTEMDENPSYRQFPMQYLYTLLLHAEQSTYQFIESQTNLACLLHEAQTGSMLCNLQVFETTRLGEGGEDFATVSREMEEVRRAEEAKLTADLKERVALTESQWREALGADLAECKERIQRFLAEKGGWDDSLDE